MRIFLTGATGALGARLVPLLVADGHEVVGTTRTPGKADSLRAAGAEPVVLDVLDRDATHEAVAKARPDVIVHQATALSSGSGEIDLRHFDTFFATTNRLRTEGTDNLIATGVRVIAQSFAGWPLARTGGPVKTEDDPLDPEPAKNARESHAAIRHLEAAVVAAGGTVLRYGGFYGPGTNMTRGEAMAEMIAKRRFPIVGDGAGVFTFCHIDDAASGTVAAVRAGKPGIFTIADDEPAPVREWLPGLAEILGAKPPRHVPAWLARGLLGGQGMVMMTSARGASNAKAKRELGWTPAYPTWREGFRRGLG
jgi:2-alkyl-3-oxoalkanoate reductase